MDERKSGKVGVCHPYPALCVLKNDSYELFINVGGDINTAKDFFMNMKMIVKITGLVLCVLFFVLPVVQCSQDSSINATSWQIASKTGRLMENADKGFPVAFILLLIPIILLIAAFVGKSFAILRVISIAGLIAKCAFIVVANILLKSDDFEGAFILTPYVWLIIVIYAGLIAFTQYCIVKKKE
jgi:hypothetical protein